MFVSQNPQGKLYRFMRLDVLSNYGNANYTCIYRFRVHGSKVCLSVFAAILSRSFVLPGAEQEMKRQNVAPLIISCLFA